MFFYYGQCQLFLINLIRKFLAPLFERVDRQVWALQPSVSKLCPCIEILSDHQFGSHYTSQQAKRYASGSLQLVSVFFILMH